MIGTALLAVGFEHKSNATTQTTQAPGLITLSSELQMPPAIATDAGGQMKLTASHGTYDIINGPAKVKTRSFVQPGSNLLVGPTIRIKPGDTVNLNFTNNLNYSAADDGDGMMSDFIPHGFDVMNIHYHGMHVTPKSPGDNVLLNVFPANTPEQGMEACSHEVSKDVAHNHVCIKGSYPYSFKVPANHPAGSFWYHPHK
ncbi:MAG: hypothetical protein ACKOEC_21515, partial [Acidimicrobiia bacterium]